jgi:hypothetical protein
VLTGAGGSMAAQFEWRGVSVVARRSSRGRRQGGQGSSQRWCGAWCGVEGVRAGCPRRLNDGEQGGAVAVKRAEEEKGCSTVGCSLYSL